MGAIIAWLARLGPWLRGLWPAAIGMLLIVWRSSRFWAISIRFAIIGAFVAVVPLPDWLTDLPGKIGDLPSAFFWFAGAVELRFGVYVVCSAFIVRWAWRLFTKAN